MCFLETPSAVIYTEYHGVALFLASPYPLSDLLSVAVATCFFLSWDVCKHHLCCTVLWDVS